MNAEKPFYEVTGLSMVPIDKDQRATLVASGRAISRSAVAPMSLKQISILLDVRCRDIAAAIKDGSFPPHDLRKYGQRCWRPATIIFFLENHIAKFLEKNLAKGRYSDADNSKSYVHITARRH